LRISHPSICSGWRTSFLFFDRSTAECKPLRFDILVEDSLLIEAKSVAKVLPIHKASY